MSYFTLCVTYCSRDKWSRATYLSCVTSILLMGKTINALLETFPVLLFLYAGDMDRKILYHFSLLTTEAMIKVVSLRIFSWMIQFDLLAFPRILADAINIFLYIPLTSFTSMTSYSSTIMASAFTSVVTELFAPVAIPEFYAGKHKQDNCICRGTRGKRSLPSTKWLSLKVKDDYSRMNSIIIGKRQIFIVWSAW